MTTFTPSDSTAAPQQKKRRGRPIDPTSGLARSRVLFATLPADSTRQAVISAFESLGVQKDTAAAYYSVLKRKR